MAGHRNCTEIMPATPLVAPVGFPGWWSERTHGCWCSAWRMTKAGLRVRRHGRWAVPNRGEVTKR